jgi:hypothetical protein
MGYAAGGACPRSKRYSGPNLPASSCTMRLHKGAKRTKRTRFHVRNRGLTWGGATGIRTPDLLHAIYAQGRNNGRFTDLALTLESVIVCQSGPPYAAVAVLGCGTQGIQGTAHDQVALPPRNSRSMATWAANTRPPK